AFSVSHVEMRKSEDLAQTSPVLEPNYSPLRRSTPPVETLQADGGAWFSARSERNRGWHGLCYVGGDERQCPRSRSESGETTPLAPSPACAPGGLERAPPASFPLTRSEFGRECGRLVGERVREDDVALAQGVLGLLREAACLVVVGAAV